MTTESDLADAIRDADDETVWSAFGQETQDIVQSRLRDDCRFVAVAFDASTDLFDADGLSRAVYPALAWAVDDRQYAVDRLSDRFDAVAIFTKTPYVSTIRRTVADAVDD
jgi:hypothetical protein